MGIEITHVRFGSTIKTEDKIVRYRWKNLNNGRVGESDKATLVNWLDNNNGIAYVGSGSDRVNVGVVHPQSGQSYVRTYADRKWTNNLLELPTF